MDNKKEEKFIVSQDQMELLNEFVKVFFNRQGNFFQIATSLFNQLHGSGQLEQLGYLTEDQKELIIKVMATSIDEFAIIINKFKNSAYTSLPDLKDFKPITFN